MYKRLPNAEPVNLAVVWAMSGQVVRTPLFADLPDLDVERMATRVRSLS